MVKKILHEMLKIRYYLGRNILKTAKYLENYKNLIKPTDSVYNFMGKYFDQTQNLSLFINDLFDLDGGLEKFKQIN